MTADITAEWDIISVNPPALARVVLALYRATNYAHLGGRVCFYDGERLLGSIPADADPYISQEPGGRVLLTLPELETTE